MEVDSHEHDWRIAEFAPNTTLGRHQANNSQLITAGHYILSSFDVHRLVVLILVVHVHHFRPERARHIYKIMTDEIVRMATDSFSTFNS